MIRETPHQNLSRSGNTLGHRIFDSSTSKFVVPYVRHPRVGAMPGQVSCNDGGGNAWTVADHRMLLVETTTFSVWLFLSRLFRFNAPTP